MRTVAQSLPKSELLTTFFRGVAVTGFVYCLWKMVKPKTEDEKVKELADKIEFSNKLGLYTMEYMEAKNVKVLKGRDLEIQLQYVPVLFSKQKEPTTKVAEETMLLAYQDPFAPPYEKGKLVCDLPPSHKLLYNKYNYCKNHFLIVTAKFEDQSESMTAQDWAQCILVIKALKGLIFFNCGQHSGYTQSHKHFQALPEEGFKFSQINLIEKACRSNRLIKKAEGQFFLYPGFNFVHGILIMNKDSKPEEYETACNQLLDRFRSILDIHNLGFNIIAWERHVLIIPRRQAAIFQNQVVSANIFLGLAMVKNIALLQDDSVTPEEVLAQVTFQWPEALLEEQ